jgi:hypothetical protein
MTEATRAAILCRVTLDKGDWSCWTFQWDREPFWVNSYDKTPECYARSIVSVIQDSIPLSNDSNTVAY